MSLSSRLGDGARAVPETWRRLSPEQRVAGVAATLLVVSTFGPFSFVELAIALIGVAVLVLLRMRALGRAFHLPFGDGTVVAAAGLWCALLIMVRVFDRPLGQNMLALGCALLLFLAGARERAKRPPDDMPAEREGAGPRRPRRSERRDRRQRPARRAGPSGRTAPADPAGPSPDAATRPLSDTEPLLDPTTRPLPEDPPEMPPPRR